VACCLAVTVVSALQNDVFCACIFACKSATGLQPGDPQWIGCWWLGYILVFVGILGTSIPLWFFPSSITARPQHRPNEDGVNSSKNARQTSIWRKLWKQVKG